MHVWYGDHAIMLRFSSAFACMHLSCNLRASKGIELFLDDAMPKLACKLASALLF